MKFVQKTSHFALLAALLLAMPASYAPPAVLTQPAPFKRALHRNFLVGTALGMLLAHPVALAAEAYKNAGSREISKAVSRRERLFEALSVFLLPQAFTGSFKGLYVVFCPEKTRDMKTFAARGKDFLQNHKAFSFFATAFLVNVGVSGSLYGKYRFDLKKFNAQPVDSGVCLRGLRPNRKYRVTLNGKVCEGLAIEQSTFTLGDLDKKKVYVLEGEKLDGGLLIMWGLVYDNIINKWTTVPSWDIAPALK